MVEVVEYRESWPARFQELKAAYAQALHACQAPYLSIEHVGSTSVPGLAAKPIIDIDIIVEQNHVDDATSALSTIGFIAQGDLGVADRYAYIAPERFAPTHTYVAVNDSISLRNHLAVRDTLRADPALRNEYAAVKKQAAQVAADIDEYIQLKSEVLGRVLERAGLSEAERDSIQRTNRAITGRSALG